MKKKKKEIMKDPRQLKQKLMAAISMLVVAGVLLTAIGVYAPLAEWAGAGATVPLTGFGYAMAKGTVQAIAQRGPAGILTGALTSASGGVTAAIICGIIASFVTRPKEK